MQLQLGNLAGGGAMRHNSFIAPTLPSNMLTSDDVSAMAYHDWKIPTSKEMGCNRPEFKNMHGLGDGFLKSYDIFDKDLQ